MAGRHNARDRSGKFAPTSVQDAQAAAAGHASNAPAGQVAA